MRSYQGDFEIDDLSVLRGQMVDLLRQIRALPGKKNHRKRRALWQLYEGYASEARQLDARRRIDYNGADNSEESDPL